MVASLEILSGGQTFFNFFEGGPLNKILESSGLEWLYLKSLK